MARAPTPASKTERLLAVVVGVVVLVAASWIATRARRRHQAQPAA